MIYTCFQATEVLFEYFWDPVDLNCEQNGFRILLCLVTTAIGMRRNKEAIF